MISRLLTIGFATAVLFWLRPSSLQAQGSQYLFPQVVDGTSGALVYNTSLLLNNPLVDPASVTIRFFLSSGLPWSIDLRSQDRIDLAGRASLRSFVLNPGETVQLFTSGVDRLAAGWARIESTAPIGASEVFDVVQPGGAVAVLTSEVGVLASPAGTQFSFFASETYGEPADGTNVDTGFAVANPGGATAIVRASLFSRTGAALGQRNLVLAPNAHTAVFISQVFNNIDFASLGHFHGLVRLSSSVNIAVVALRQTFGNSNTIASIPVNQDVDLGYNIIYDREPNDTTSSAQPIGGLPAEIVGTMNSFSDGDDTDVFSVELKAGQVLYVMVLADMLGSPLDDALQIVDSVGNPVATVDTFAIGLKDPFVRYQVPQNGTYFISHRSSAGTGARSSSYRMHVMAR